jgi:hypothetical protein
MCPSPPRRSAGAGADGLSGTPVCAAVGCVSARRSSRAPADTLGAGLPLRLCGAARHCFGYWGLGAPKPPPGRCAPALRVRWVAVLALQAPASASTSCARRPRSRLPPGAPRRQGNPSPAWRAPPVKAKPCGWRAKGARASLDSARPAAGLWPPPGRKSGLGHRPGHAGCCAQLGGAPGGRCPGPCGAVAWTYPACAHAASVK